MHLANRIRDRGRGHRPAYTPTGNGVRLRQAIDGDGALAHTLKRSYRNVPGAVVENVFVDFIGDGKHVEFHAQVADQLKFAAGKHFAGGIVRSIYDDRFSVTVKRRSQLAFIECPLAVRRLCRTQLPTPPLDPGNDRIQPVIFLERLEEHDIVPGIAARQPSKYDSFGGAATNRDVALAM